MSAANYIVPVDHRQCHDERTKVGYSNFDRKIICKCNWHGVAQGAILPLVFQIMTFRWLRGMTL